MRILRCPECGLTSNFPDDAPPGGEIGGEPDPSHCEHRKRHGALARKQARRSPAEKGAARGATTPITTGSDKKES